MAVKFEEEKEIIRRSDCIHWEERKDLSRRQEERDTNQAYSVIATGFPKVSMKSVT